MSLSARERVGCWRLLGLLDTADLYSLADTVTQKKGAGLRSREGAIDAILGHSQSATQLLSRRKVNCCILSQYLSNEGVSVKHKSTKLDLVQKVISHWKELDISSRVNFIQDTEQFLPLVQQRPIVADTEFTCSLSFHVSKLSINDRQEDVMWRVTTPTKDTQVYVSHTVYASQTTACALRDVPDGANSPGRKKATQQKYKRSSVSDKCTTKDSKGQSRPANPK